MKKSLLKASTALAALAILAGSPVMGVQAEGLPAYEAGAALEDGEYRVVTDPDERGYTSSLVLTVEDGEVTELVFDQVDADGLSKRDNEDYNTAWQDKDGVTFPEVADDLGQQVVDSQSPEVDTVSGATGASSLFSDLATVALAMAQNGVTEEVNYSQLAGGQVIPAYVEGGALEDGEYRLVTHPDERGYTTSMEMKVEGGDVLAVYFDQVDADGLSKRDNEDYNTAWQDKDGVTFPEVADAIESQILDKQAAEVDAISGATGASGQAGSMAEVLFAMAQHGITEEVNFDDAEYAGAQEAEGAEGQSAADLEDGSYTATVEAHNGDLTVEVDVEDGKITAVTITDHQETEGLADPALEEVPAAIVEANSTDVDTVSGATVTAQAIIDAVNQALAGQ